MNVTDNTNNPQEIQDDQVKENKIEQGDAPSDITLSHKEAKAGSPYDNSGNEDPGAALELLITKLIMMIINKSVLFEYFVLKLFNIFHKC